jgi:hypothetical protein
MPLAVAVLFVVPCLLAPVLTAKLAREAVAEERRQIAFDNGAIAVGRGVRWALRALGAAEQAFRAFDRGHDALHACARVKPACRVADAAAERALAAMHRGAEAAFRRGVLVAVRAAVPELARGGARGRTEAPPLSLATVRCRFCRLPVGWRVRIGTAAVVEAARPARRRRVSWEGSGERWDYRVRWAPGEGALSSN